MSKDGFFASFKRLLGAKQIAPLPASTAERLYHQILQASRAVPLYRDYGIEDSIDGRFDALCLMQSLVMRRLSARSEALTALSQELFDAMFADMDLTLREMGVGDMGVGKRVKFMSEAYMGRLSAYDKALSAYEAGDGEELLQQALHRNIYREGAVTGDEAGLAKSVIAIDAKVAALDEEAFLSGQLPDDVLDVAPQTANG